MSYGLAICANCHKEVHQTGDSTIEKGWIHCEDNTPRCADAGSIYAEDKTQIVGNWCGADDF